jgi:hypothetical protein
MHPGAACRRMRAATLCMRLNPVSAAIVACLLYINIALAP